MLFNLIIVLRVLVLSMGSLYEVSLSKKGYDMFTEYNLVLSQERLDFSCALFGPDGGLVANAPHIPVHLGAMQETVQWQVRYACMQYLRVLYTLAIPYNLKFSWISRVREWLQKFLPQNFRFMIDTRHG